MRLRHHRLVRRGLMYSLALAAVILLLGGVGFWLLDPTVYTFSDGLWLAFTTAATVGYGDVVPSTHASRMFAVVVVLLGLAVLSMVTASLAAIFVEQEVEVEDKHSELEMLAELRILRHELHVVRLTLEQLQAQRGITQESCYQNAASPSLSLASVADAPIPSAAEGSAPIAAAAQTAPEGNGAAAAATHREPEQAVAREAA